ncbi:MAG: SPFH domain-containing protein, partial [Pirellulaceae bacterium]
MTTIDDHRWQLADEDFASRVDLPDAKTFFDQNLLIEEGTRALVLENGHYQGEVLPGQYTLAAFSADLPEWSQQQATVILSRVAGEQLEISFQQIPTRDNIQVNVFFHAEVRLNNPAHMLRSMPDASAKMTVETLLDTVQKILEQAAWESVRAQVLGDLGTVISDHIQQNERLHKRLDAKGIQLVQLRLFSFQQVGSEAIELVGEELMLDGREVQPESGPEAKVLQLGDDQLVLDGHEVKDSLDNEATSMSSLADDSARP